MFGSASHVSVHESCLKQSRAFFFCCCLQGLVGFLLEVLQQWHLSHEQDIQLSCRLAGRSSMARSAPPIHAVIMKALYTCMATPQAFQPFVGGGGLRLCGGLLLTINQQMFDELADGCSDPLSYGSLGPHLSMLRESPSSSILSGTSTLLSL